MPASPPIASDVRRAVLAFVALAVVALVLAGLYAAPSHFADPSGRGLPDISPTAIELSRGFQVLAALALGWAGGLVVLGTPATAASARQRLREAVRREGEAPWAWAAAGALAVAYATARMAFTHEIDPARLADLVAGEASLPFQYRALVPALVGLVAALPGVAAVPLAALFGVVEATAALGAWAAFRRFLRPHLGGAPEAAGARASVLALALFVPLGLGLASPWRYNAIYFPWDTVSVAAFTLGLALLQERRWGAFYALFAVATLNRETTCFLTVALVLAEVDRRPEGASLWRHLGGLAAHGGAQLAIWLGVKTALAAAFAGNAAPGAEAGGLFVPTYVRSVWILTSVPGWAYLGLAMGGAWLVPLLLRQRLAGVRWAPYARVVPVFLLGMALVGELLEVRIYAELLPLATAGLVLSLASVVREAAARAPAARAPAPARAAEPAAA